MYRLMSFDLSWLMQVTQGIKSDFLPHSESSCEGDTVVLYKCVCGRRGENLSSFVLKKDTESWLNDFKDKLTLWWRGARKSCKISKYDCGINEPVKARLSLITLDLLRELRFSKSKYELLQSFTSEQCVKYTKIIKSFGAPKSQNSL